MSSRRLNWSNWSVLGVPCATDGRKDGEHPLNGNRSDKRVVGVELRGSNCFIGRIEALDVGIDGHGKRAIGIKSDLALRAANGGNGCYAVLGGYGEGSVGVERHSGEVG